MPVLSNLNDAKGQRRSRVMTMIVGDNRRSPRRSLDASRKHPEPPVSISTLVLTGPRVWTQIRVVVKMAASAERSNLRPKLSDPRFDTDKILPDRSRGSPCQPSDDQTPSHIERVSSLPLHPSLGLDLGTTMALALCPTRYLDHCSRASHPRSRFPSPSVRFLGFRSRSPS